LILTILFNLHNCCISRKRFLPAYYHHDLCSFRITLVLGQIANSSATGCNLEILHQRIVTQSVSVHPRESAKPYYRGCRRADRPDLPSVYRPRWSSMPVYVSCQPIYLPSRSGFTMCSSLFSGSQRLSLSSVVHRHFSLSLSLSCLLACLLALCFSALSIRREKDETS